MFYVETGEDGDEVFIHLDRKGIQRLREVLDSLEGQPDQPEHEHLLTEDWGGHDLDNSLISGSRDTDSEINRTVHHAKLYYWPND